MQLTGAGFHGLDVGNTDSRSLAHRNEHSRVVEVIAVASETSHDGVANCCQARPVKNCATNEISSIIIRLLSLVLFRDGTYRVGSLLALWPSMMTGKPLTYAKEGSLIA